MKESKPFRIDLTKGEEEAEEEEAAEEEEEGEEEEEEEKPEPRKGSCFVFFVPYF